MKTGVGRREFMKSAAAAALAGGLHAGAQPEGAKMSEKMIWGNLLHLGMNMWADRLPTPEETKVPHWDAKPHLRFEDSLWDHLLKRMADVGMNMVAIDLGEGVKYESHPELGVKGSWTPTRLREEIAKAHEMGLEPIPKLNFSAGHDIWLGPYSRMLSTDTYYKVCGELIAEVCELFDRPRFFHLGMDEETAQHQRFYRYVVVRQYDLWWHDLDFLVNAVEKGGSRAWVWSDYMWHHPERFFKNMDKNVLQSNWYYGDKFNKDVKYVKAYHDLDEKGYDQVPTGSNWSNDVNFEKTVEYCSKAITEERLKGFLMAPWKPTLEECRDHHMAAIDQVARAMMLV
jgi:hypothetical protein